MEDMVGDGGQSPAVEETVGWRWRWCRCSGVAGSNGEMGSHHGDEREREKEEKQKRNKGVAGAREATASGTTGSDMRVVHINVASDAKPSQSEILLEFKNSLRNVTALGSWNTSTTPCGGSPGGWVGVICINGDVWGLQLEGMGLMGTIDMDTLAKLPHLRGISFMNNHFDGAIPKIKKLSALKSVFLSNNQFSGEIEDDAFSGMVSLKKVHLAHNKFSGGVPESLALLPRILELRLEGNHFKGQIPEFRATQLQSFNISNNNLEGPIPESLRRWS
ncbi:Pollen receptor-like kinase 4 [Vitis vinifera]|uniref:Pollen receptor-like kinase 4 n=1 Tax=Vitis vinifera TaxID=29760 RepID=A0A438HWK7_VITVI|nr:Pollen receptor-like kinase 4 [Vitis vinifera]